MTGLGNPLAVQVARKSDPFPTLCVSSGIVTWAENIVIPN